MFLDHYGLFDEPNDLDIFIDIKDVAITNKVIANVGRKKEVEPSDLFATKHYMKYEVSNGNVDIMAGFHINHSHGLYEYIFDIRSITTIEQINGENIPFGALEDWYVNYQLMPYGRDKVPLIKKYLQEHGIKYPHLLRRAQRGCLPPEVKDSISELLLSKAK